MELAILGWLFVFAVVAGGAFVIARSIVQIAAVAYGTIEKQLDHRDATRRTVLLAAAGVVALVLTALVAATAIIVVLASFLAGSTF